MGQFIDETGKVYNSWTVLRCSEDCGMWICRCVCGREFEVKGYSLRSGASKQCRNCQNKTHGLTGTLTYESHRSAQRRCRDKNHDRYQDYGVRGIQMCDALYDSTEYMVKILKKSHPGGETIRTHTLDRIKGELTHYSCGQCEQCKSNGWPMNIRWATMKEQSRTRSSNTAVAWRGETRTVVEWSEITGLSWDTIWQRLFKRQWDVERALTQPARVTKKPEKYVDLFA